MYRTEPDKLQNDKCFSCKYCIWDEERKTEVCDIKGCYKNSKFVWFGGSLVGKDKNYCHLCNIDLEDDKEKDKQFSFTADYIDRHYCSKCAKYGESIMDEFIKKTSRKRACGEYYDAYDLIKLIESLHKDCHGNFKISFDNNFGYDESLVKAPITKDGKPIGVITDVTPEKVEGFIWERYMPIVAELDHNQKPVSFEIVY